MLALIKIDLKQRIRSPLTWFIIFILLLMSMLHIIEVKEDRLNRTFKGHDIYRFEDRRIDWTIYIDEREKKLYPKAYFSWYTYTKLRDDSVKANEKNDIKEITRIMTFYQLMTAKAGYVFNDPIMNMVFYNKVIKMWNDVSGGIPYEDIDFYPTGNVFRVGKYAHLLYAKYYYQLYIKEYEPIYSDDINNVTYLYNYFFNIIPKLIVIISIIFIYNIINKDKNKGSLKLVLTQSIDRRKYYMSKWISGIIHLIFIIFFPAIIISTILGLTQGFVPLDYPTIYLRDSMTSFKPIPNYFDAIKQKAGYYPRFWFEKTFSYYAPSHKTISNPGHFYPSEKMEIVPFYQYLLMVIFLTILFIGFTVSLIQLISAIIDKEIISFIASTVVFIVGTLISSPFKYDKHLNLSPFTMEHASRIVIGTYNVTALVSTIILISSTILLLIIGCKYFKKKEI